jgi:hypothetical protein
MRVLSRKFFVLRLLPAVELDCDMQRIAKGPYQDTARDEC